MVRTVFRGAKAPGFGGSGYLWLRCNLGRPCVSYSLAGLWQDFLAYLGGFAFAIPLSTFLSMIMARYASRQIERLRDYSQSMMKGSLVVSLSPLYSLRNVLIFGAILSLVSNAVYVFGSTSPQYSPTQIALTKVLPWLYIQFIWSTFLWVWAYALYKTYQLGNLPLELKPFTDDRTLGLKPFATVSLRLTAIYVALITLIGLPQVIFGIATLPVLAFGIGLYFLALPFFLLPLRGLRRKLLSAKRDELSWITQRYTQRMQQLKKGPDDPLDDKPLNALADIKEIQKEARQIPSWPSDTGILVRLTAILLSVTGILLARMITIALHL